MAGFVMGAALICAPPAAAQSCSGVPPFTCEATFTDDSFLIPFTLTATRDFTAFSSNFDPFLPVSDAADVLLLLLDDNGLILDQNDDGGADYLLNNGELFQATVAGTEYTAGGVFDALLFRSSLPAGDYQLQVNNVFAGLETTFGNNFRVHLFDVSPE